ncbi:MAG: hypothetical protein IIX01_02785, partial [Clostridia bacterium]|nr:hypothetical protein [Clostridia bacterium]
EEAEKNELSERLEDFLLQAGAYGSMENRVAVQQAKKGGKFRYLISLIWLPFPTLKIVYPSLEKRKWLYPFYQVRRWFRILFKGLKSTTKQHIQTSNSITKEQRNDVAQLLKDLEL